jgi:hypothetical protein
MKKVKFTLGLMLAMLFMGATVMNAAENIKLSASMGASEFYGGVDGITIDTVKVYRGVEISSTSIFKGHLNDLQTKGISDADLGTWSGGDLTKYQRDRNYKAYNRITVQLRYNNGNDLMPVIKRTLTLKESDFVIVNYLVADESFFKPHMDRKSGIATYTYNDDVLEMLDKYPHITGIKYEITINDEVGTPGVGDYQPPVYSDVTVMHALSIETEDGITTNPSAQNSGTKGIVYVPSQKDFVFTAFSSEDIVVTTDRGNDDQGGVMVKGNGDGSYTVTIKRVLYNFTITIKQLLITESNSGGDGTTANTTVTADAVWAAGGTLYANAANPGTISIYNITGQLYKIESISGSYTLSMPKGIYIVQLNGKAYKVVL